MIHEKIKELLKGIADPVIFELGCNNGIDTQKLANIKGSTVYALEADKTIRPLPLPCNVIFGNIAIASHTGTIEFIQSDKYGSDDWNYSGSIKKPKNHLKQYPEVKFKEQSVIVDCITLDDFCTENKIDHIDFIWADLQGAEEEFIKGGKEILKSTRYIYTEFSDKEMYSGQINLNGILNLLQGWEVMLIHNDGETNALLKNGNYKS